MARCSRDRAAPARENAGSRGLTVGVKTRPAHSGPIPIGRHVGEPTPTMPRIPARARVEALAGALLVRGLHLLPPETAHALTIRALASGLAPTATPPASGRLRTSFCGFEL